MSLVIQKWFDEDLDAPLTAGGISGTCPVTFANTALLTGRGALAGTAALTFSNTGAVTGRAPITGAAALTFANTAVLGGRGALTSAVAVTFANTGALTGRGALAGEAALVFANAGELSGGAVGGIAGEIALQFAISGALAGSGALTGVVALTFANTGTLSGGGVVPPVVVGDTPAGRPARRRQRVVYRLFYKGKPLLFDDVESLLAFLQARELEAERTAERTAERDAIRIERVGRAAAAPRPPLVRLRSPVPEIGEFITALQEKIDALYWRKLQTRLVNELDEEEDVVILASILDL